MLQIVAGLDREARDDARRRLAPRQRETFDRVIERAGVDEPVARGRRSAAAFAGVDAAQASVGVAIDHESKIAR